jgi:hypothetical protein
MIFIRQGFTNRSRKVDECMIHMIAEARRTAGKSRLETVLLIQPKPEEAQSRKAEGQSGEPGFLGM